MVKKRQHGFQSISNDIKKSKVKNKVLLFGKEQFLVEWAKALLIEENITEVFKMFDFVILEKENISLESIMANCETLPLGSKKRVVILEDPPFFPSEKNEKLSDSEGKKIEEYLCDVPEQTLMIIKANNVDKRKKIYKAIEQTGSVYEFNSLDREQLVGFIEKRLKLADKTITTSALNYIIESSGYFNRETEYTLYQLDNDLKTILAFSDNEEIDYSDVISVMEVSLDKNIFTFIDLISRGKKGEGVFLLRNLLKTGENGYKILGLIFSQFELILLVKELRDKGENLQGIKNILQIHEFRIKKTMELSNKFSFRELKKILEDGYVVDKNIKTGLLKEELALEMFLTKIGR